MGVEVCVNPAVGCCEYGLTVLAPGSSSRDGGGGQAVALLHESFLRNSPSLQVFKASLEQPCSGSVPALSRRGGVWVFQPKPFHGFRSEFPRVLCCASSSRAEGWFWEQGAARPGRGSTTISSGSLITFLSGVWLGKAGPWKMHAAAAGRGFHSLGMAALGEQSVQPGMQGWALSNAQGSSKSEFKDTIKKIKSIYTRGMRQDGECSQAC